MSATVDTLDILESLGGPGARGGALEPWLIVEAQAASLRAAYHRLRREEFVHTQGLFAASDRDAADEDPRTRALVAVSREGEVLGGVRLHPERDGGELGWWRGSRLVVHRAARPRGAVGRALVTAACAHALDAGALRFDAHVQLRQVEFFTRLGWIAARPIRVAGQPHMLMRWDPGRFAALAGATKALLGELVGALLPDDRWRGDDGVPVPGSALVTSVDAITPSMVQRDPEWAGWCGMLVTAHDLAAMGAGPIGALDALGATDRAHAAAVIKGVRAGAQAFALPILGGHTQLGVPAALSVTGFGHAPNPVPAGGGRVGDVLRLTADLAGGWRPGYHGRQWDSTTTRTRAELEPMLSAVGRARPAAAKDVSMAGIVGTTGMLAEASGCGAELEVARVPRPASADVADWLTCFPGFAMVTADRPGAPPLPAGDAVSAACGVLTSSPGVRLRWPDGDLTTALSGPTVSGLGRARPKVSP